VLVVVIAVVTVAFFGSLFFAAADVCPSDKFLFFADGWVDNYDYSAALSLGATG
jgi:hypothetical protein